MDRARFFSTSWMFLFAQPCEPHLSHRLFEENGTFRLRIQSYCGGSASSRTPANSIVLHPSVTTGKGERRSFRHRAQRCSYFFRRLFPSLTLSVVDFFFAAFVDPFVGTFFGLFLVTVFFSAAAFLTGDLLLPAAFRLGLR